LRLLKLSQNISKCTPGKSLRNTRGCPLYGKGFDKKGNLIGGGDIKQAIMADYALDYILGAFLGLDLISKEAHKTEVQIEKGEVSCEARVIGFVVSTPWYNILYYFVR